VFSSLDPTPAPSVLATKHGKALGHAHARGQVAKADKAKKRAGEAAATPTSLTFLGVSPTANSRHARGEHGRPTHAGSGHGRGAHQSAVPVSDPALPVPAPVIPATSPTADPSGPGNGHAYAYAYGHDKV
jgi:hypothetical protein